MQVGGAISSLEDSKEGHVAGGVWFADIDHLHVQLEASSALTTSDLNQTSEEGIVLSCHVRPLPDLSRKYQGRVLLKT